MIGRERRESPSHSERDPNEAKKVPNADCRLGNSGISKNDNPTVLARYRIWRWIAPRLPTRRSRDWAWRHKWRLWHTLNGPHQSLWGIA